MLKHLKPLLLLLFAINFLHAQTLKEVSKEQLKEIQALALVQNAKITVHKGFDLGNLLILDSSFQGKRQELFLTKDKSILIAGSAVDTKSGQPVTLPIDLSITNNKEAFTFGSGKDEYILFTDMQCPYCKKFESFFPQLEDKVKIRVFFYPLAFHEQADELSIFVMNQKTKEEKIEAFLNITEESEAFKKMKLDKNEEARLRVKLQEQMKIAQQLNVAGTPTLFDANGNKVVWVRLLEKYGISE
jgi:thiol:disulfide interchange protein DsbC